MWAAKHLVRHQTFWQQLHTPVTLLITSCFRRMKNARLKLVCEHNFLLSVHVETDTIFGEMQKPKSIASEKKT